MCTANNIPLLREIDNYAEIPDDNIDQNVVNVVNVNNIYNEGVRIRADIVNLKVNKM